MKATCSVRTCPRHPQHGQEPCDAATPVSDVDCFELEVRVGKANEVVGGYAVEKHSHQWWDRKWATTPQAWVGCANFARCPGCKCCQPLPEWATRSEALRALADALGSKEPAPSAPRPLHCFTATLADGTEVDVTACDKAYYCALEQAIRDDPDARPSPHASNDGVLTLSGEPFTIKVSPIAGSVGGRAQITIEEA